MNEFYPYVLVVFSMLLSAICFYYSVDRLFGKRVPWYLALVGGVITNVLIIPVAMLCCVLEMADARYPLFK